ncbi:DUF1365 domain-containing protein [Bordetella genomosp. 5]|uniref:Chromosome partitioning protein ParA n=1 Tax=Bordetella genomosp. 5 TaxID=1395608 RepID=A0A261T8W4_9BORD|nr:DUF1365 domain-containing protein [Bordetella genomosp. 5]OZI45865.1 chromosome partitioning protein ParA [Bordetella genomosp. 5]
MNAPLHSAVYEGRVTHTRHLPVPHAFGYRMAQLYLDLDEIDRVFDRRWLWSVNRSNLAQWRRADYLGDPAQPLADAVRERIRAVRGVAPSGPIRMLAHLRYGGHVFNPVSFYYCFGPDGHELDCIVAEVTNTPWRERHAYVLPRDDAERHGRVWSWRFDKRFHVSPFMGMERGYDWRFTEPGDDLRVHMKVLRGARAEFDADLALQRHALDGAALARVLWRYPLMTLQVMGAIHWQALRLWLKHTPVHDHPRHSGGGKELS